MNERIKKAGIAFAIIALIFAAGFLGGRYSRSGELREAQEQLRDANGYSDQLRERLEESRRAVGELEGLAESRQRTIRELEEDLQFSIARARERDEIIARLEGQVGSLRGDTAELRRLIKEGEAIVDGLLGQDTVD